MSCSSHPTWSPDDSVKATRKAEILERMSTQCVFTENLRVCHYYSGYSSSYSAPQEYCDSSARSPRRKATSPYTLTHDVSVLPFASVATGRVTMVHCCISPGDKGSMGRNLGVASSELASNGKGRSMQSVAWSKSKGCDCGLCPLRLWLSTNNAAIIPGPLDTTQWCRNPGSERV